MRNPVRNGWVFLCANRYSMSRIIQSFEEFNQLDESYQLESLDEGFFGNLADRAKNGLSRMFGGAISKLDSIYGKLDKNGKFVGKPQGELGKLEYDFIVANVQMDEEILKRMSASRQFANSSTAVPPEAMIANNEFMKRQDLLRQANKKRHDARKEAVLDRIESIVGDNGRVGAYAQAAEAQMNSALAETEYNLRKKFASKEEQEKLEDKLVQARKDAVDKVARLQAMLAQMGLTNSQAAPQAAAQAAPAPVRSANGRQSAAPANAPAPVAPHTFVP